MCSSLWTTLKRFGINLHYRQSLYYILQSTWSRRSSHKNVCSFISSSSKRTPNQFDLLRCICHVALLLFLHVCYRVNGIFCLFWLVFFFNVNFPLSLCSLSFFFYKERLVISPSSHPFIHFSTYLPFYLIYLQDIRKMRLLLC